MSRICFDFRARARVPQADSAILATRQHIFRATFCISCDVHRTFVAVKSLMEASSQRLRTSRGSHERAGENRTLLGPGRCVDDAKMNNDSSLDPSYR